MSHTLSCLLSAHENGRLIKLLSPDCTVIACGIAQVVVASSPQKQWTSHGFGVVCLVQDKELQSTFIRLYSLKKAEMTWEQELYMPFQYSEVCPYFHTFPGDEFQSGINFADENEAKDFYDAVQKTSDKKAAQPVLIRRHSTLGSFSDWREKLNKCLSGHELQKSHSVCIKAPHCLDSGATSPKTRSACLTQILSDVNEASTTLAMRKGPVPPLPSHARDAAEISKQSQSRKNSVELIPPPPSYPAPKGLISYQKRSSLPDDKSSEKQSRQVDDENDVFDDYL